MASYSNWYRSGVYHTWHAVDFCGVSMKELANELFFEHHACLTGDCPHRTTQECLVAAHVEGYKAALESEEVRGLIVNVRHSGVCTFFVRRFDRDCDCGAVEALTKFKGVGEE